MTGRTPVVVVTGFLGSGKTTLLNALLRRRAARAGDAGGKLAVIVNELGEVGVDGDLLAGGGARQIELPGGCVCCVLGDDLAATVLELIRDQPGLVAIVLETTGVAEPLPIAWAFERAPLLAAARLAAIVTLVDATTFAASRPISPAVDEQVRHADVLVITKAELADPAAVEAEARRLAPAAPVVRGSTAEVAAWLDGVLADLDVLPERERAHVDDHDHHDDHDHAHDGHVVDSVWVPVRDTVDVEELEDQLAALPGRYIRIKGIVRGVDGRGGDEVARWYAVHRVGLRVSSEPAAVSGPVEGRLVALGSGVDRAPLTACIEAAVLSSFDDEADR